MSLSEMYSVEPLSPALSVSSELVMDLDEENQDPPVYTELNSTPSLTPPRLFGAELTNSSSSSNTFLIDNYSTGYSHARNYDFGSYSPLPGSSPLLSSFRENTLTSCILGPNCTHNTLQGVLDSPTSSRSADSNFSFPEPNGFQINSSAFDAEYNFSSIGTQTDSVSIASLIGNHVQVKIEDDYGEKPLYIQGEVERDSDDSGYYSASSPGVICGSSIQSSPISSSTYTNQVVVKSEDAGDVPGTLAEDRMKAKKIFPYRLYELASDENFEPLYWNGDGTMLVVNMQTITRHLMKICRSKKFASFLRQLHLYGFRKDARCLPNQRSQVKTAYYQHPFFVRENPELLDKINRVKL